MGHSSNLTVTEYTTNTITRRIRDQCGGPWTPLQRQLLFLALKCPQPYIADSDDQYMMAGGGPSVLGPSVPDLILLGPSGMYNIVGPA
jgi:hypothetical protein